MALVETLSVIIGIIFIWMLLGVAVMQIQEWTVGWLSLRAESLEDAIQGMLLAPKQRRGPWGRLWEQLKKRRVIRSLPWIRPDIPPALVQNFYGHPLIRSLEQQRANPSYLPPEIFSLVLLDTVMVAGLDASAIGRALAELKRRWPETVSREIGQKLQELVKLADEAANPAGAPEQLGELRRQLGEFRTLLARQRSGNQTEERDLLDLLEAVLRTQLPNDVDEVMAHVERGSAALFATSPLLQQRLEVLIRQAAIDATTAADRLDLLRRQIEGWFEDTMDHVTGWYKRNRQWGAFAIGFVIAAFINLDSIHITTELWRQPAVRQALVMAAAQEIETQVPEPEAVEPGAALESLEESLSALRVPVGWQDAPTGWGILTKLVGIVITAAAAMQGAPFWFDVLDKIVPIRAAGVPPGGHPGNNGVDKRHASPTRSPAP